MAKKSVVLTDPKLIEHFLTRAVENVYPTPEELRKKLLSGERIRVYHGIDPTGPSLHLGHMIPLRKLAVLQSLGHHVILLIGDFTAMIGDPTDKSATRKQLTRDEVLANCRLYREQASKVLDFEGKNPVEMRFNSEWLAPMPFPELIQLTSHFTAQRIMERDMFEKREAEGKPIHLHEFLYPVMQGYDSVALDVDLEIGGNDQTFNMLAGRTLMRKMKNKEKFVLTTKLLVDPSGKKMGKSEGNMVALTDAPEDMYGKVMSWSDDMIVPGFELCTDVPDEEIAEIAKRIKKGENPIAFKRRLAKEIVAFLVSRKAAEEAETQFANVHQKHETPEEIPTFPVGKGIKLVDALIGSKLVLPPSKSEARRQVEQGGVKVDGKVAKDIYMEVKAGSVIQKGKRHFVRLV